MLGAALAFVAPRAAQAEALLLIEADSGKVLQAENATMPWYPASLSKLMTAYVTLKAVKEGRITGQMVSQEATEEKLMKLMVLASDDRQPVTT